MEMLAKLILIIENFFAELFDETTVDSDIPVNTDASTTTTTADSATVTSDTPVAAVDAPVADTTTVVEVPATIPVIDAVPAPKAQ